MEEHVPSMFRQSKADYENKAPSFRESAERYNKEEKASDQPSGARHVMQASIGVGKGALLKGPAGIPSVIADAAFPGAVTNVMDELEESDKELQENLAKYTNDIPFPLQREVMEKGSKELQDKILGKEGFSVGLMTLPYRVFGIESAPKNTGEKITRDAFTLLSMLAGGGPGNGGGGPGNGGGGGGGGIGPPGLSLAKDIAKDYGKYVPLAFTSASLGELGESIYGVGGRAIMDVLFFGAVAAGYKIKQYTQQIPTNKTKMAEQAMSPDQRNTVEPYLKIADKHNIPVSIGTIADNPYVRSVEMKIASSNMTMKERNQFRQDSADSWGRLYKEFLTSSENASQYESQGAIAQKLKEAVMNPAEKKMVEEASKLYGLSEDLFHGAKPLPPSAVREIEESLNRVYSKTSQSLIPTSAEKEVQNIASEARGNLSTTPAAAGRQELEGVVFPVGKHAQMTREQSQKATGEVFSNLIESEPGKRLSGKLGQKRTMRAKSRVQTEEKRRNVPKELIEAEVQKAQGALEAVFGKEAENMTVTNTGQIRFIKDVKPGQIVATVRSLNNTIEWDHPEVRNLFQESRKVLKNVLEDNYRATHGPALDAYYEANHTFGKAAKMFTGDKAKYRKWNLSSESTPESLASELNSIEKFKRFEKDFGKEGSEGKQLLEYMKRKKLDEMLKNTFDKASYQYLPGVISGKINLLKDNQYAKYLAGPETWKKFEEIAALDKFISKNATNIYTAGIPTDVQNNFIKDLKMAGFIFAPTSTSLAAAATMAGAEHMRKEYLTKMATLYSDKALMEEAITIARHAPKWKQSPSYWQARMEQFQQSLKMKESENEMINNLTSTPTQ